MKRENNSTVKSIINSLKVSTIVPLIILVMLAIFISVIPVDNIWNKILSIGYIVAAVALLVILGRPMNGKDFCFGKITFVSFMVWCVCIPIIAGILIDTSIIKIAPSMPFDDVALWVIAICITISSFAWFLTKLYKNDDAIGYLELYSTTWIVLITIITTLFDLQEKKTPFVLLLTVYFVLQFLIKNRMCKIQEKRP